ncbi:MAG TPA: DUF1850 domain-containing protein [Syntrophales bacterium]
MKRLYWTLAVAALLALAAGFIPLHGLEVRESGGTGRVVLLKRVAPGDTFTLSFVHSVEKSEVTDYFRIDDDHRIILYQTEFGSLNTGLPAVVSGGEVFERTDRGFRLSNLNRVLPEIQLWVHEDYGGSFAMDGRVVSLPALAGKGLLRITTRRVFAWELLPRALRL